MSSQAEVEQELARLKGISAPQQPDAIESGAPQTPAQSGEILDADEKQQSASEAGQDTQP
jgi:hypothetical protein